MNDLQNEQIVISTENEQIMNTRKSSTIHLKKQDRKRQALKKY